MNKIIFTCSEHEIDLFSLSIQEKVLRHHFPFQFFEKDVPHVEAMMVALHKVNASFTKKLKKNASSSLGSQIREQCMQMFVRQSVRIAIEGIKIIRVLYFSVKN